MVRMDDPIGDLFLDYDNSTRIKSHFCYILLLETHWYNPCERVPKYISISQECHMI